MKSIQIISAIVAANLSLYSNAALSEVSDKTQIENIIGWNITESDLKADSINNLLTKAGGEAAIGRIETAAKPYGLLSGLAIKKSKRDHIAPMLMGIACRLDYCQGDRTKAAIYYFTASADLGNFRAMQELAQLLPAAEATPWFKRAAEAGYPGAMNGYGYALASGAGTNQDINAAFTWFQRSSELGDAEGTYNVGVSHFNGYGVPVDKDEAILWFQRAADSGNSSAMLNLGRFYLDGDGVAQDRNRGFALIQNSAAAGNIEATKQIAEIGRAEEAAAITEAKQIEAGILASESARIALVKRNAAVAASKYQPKLGDRWISGVTCKKYVWQTLPDGKKQYYWSSLILGEHGLVGHCDRAVNLQVYFDLKSIEKLPDFDRLFTSIQNGQAYIYSAKDMTLACKDGKVMKIYGDKTVEVHRQVLGNSYSERCYVGASERYRGLITSYGTTGSG